VGGRDGAEEASGFEVAYDEDACSGTRGHEPAKMISKTRCPRALVLERWTARGPGGVHPDPTDVSLDRALVGWVEAELDQLAAVRCVGAPRGDSMPCGGNERAQVGVVQTWVAVDWASGAPLYRRVKALPVSSVDGIGLDSGEGSAQARDEEANTTRRAVEARKPGALRCREGENAAACARKAFSARSSCLVRVR